MPVRAFLRVVEAFSSLGKLLQLFKGDSYDSSLISLSIIYLPLSPSSNQPLLGVEVGLQRSLLGETSPKCLPQQLCVHISAYHSFEIFFGVKTRSFLPCIPGI